MRIKPLLLFLNIALTSVLISIPSRAHAESSSKSNSDTMLEQIQKERSEIEGAREWANYHQRLEEIACYQKFFVTACLEDVQERFRQERAVLRKREINNNQAQRNYDAQQREAKKLQEKLEKEAKQPQENQRREENRSAYQQKLEDAKHRLEEQNSPKKQEERRQNKLKHQQKQQDAEQRRQELEQQNKEKKQPHAPSDFILTPNNGSQGDR